MEKTFFLKKNATRRTKTKRQLQHKKHFYKTKIDETMQNYFTVALKLRLTKIGTKLA